MLFTLWYPHCLVHWKRGHRPFPCLIIADLRTLLIRLRLSVQLFCHGVLDVIVVGKLTLVSIATSALAEHPAHFFAVNCPASLLLLGHGHMLLQHGHLLVPLCAERILKDRVIKFHSRYLFSFLHERWLDIDHSTGSEEGIGQHFPHRLCFRCHLLLHLHLLLHFAFL